eukprot:CAMPEP_0195543746 /NCGR_PEP_ID=MMETSP0794_2-20130614/52274_1 /TAXON_ID=515487 /ORGANISM="Stephanopyxis turris, Strain CCMP 815" /LENGTH=53 /DNA_ID=CAMNT_0040677909 /DNA_START=537 /DNA_END=698 /DNA_ORIENTATION=+
MSPFAKTGNGSGNDNLHQIIRIGEGKALNKKGRAGRKKVRESARLVVILGRFL